MGTSRPDSVSWANIRGSTQPLPSTLRSNSRGLAGISPGNASRKDLPQCGLRSSAANRSAAGRLRGWWTQSGCRSGCREFPDLARKSAPLPVFSMMQDKDLRAVSEILTPLFEQVYLVELTSTRAASASRLKKAFPQGVVMSDLKRALTQARRRAASVLVFGSFRLAGRCWRKERLWRTAGADGSLDPKQELPTLDRGVDADIAEGDCARPGRLQLVLHFHRLNDHQPSPASTSSPAFFRTATTLPGIWALTWATPCAESAAELPFPRRRGS